jgi:hypothetical protein
VISSISHHQISLAAVELRQINAPGETPPQTAPHALHVPGGLSSAPTYLLRHSQHIRLNHSQQSHRTATPTTARALSPQQLFARLSIQGKGNQSTEKERSEKSKLFRPEEIAALYAEFTTLSVVGSGGGGGGSGNRGQQQGDYRNGYPVIGFIPSPNGEFVPVVDFKPVAAADATTPLRPTPPPGNIVVRNQAPPPLPLKAITTPQLKNVAKLVPPPQARLVPSRAQTTATGNTAAKTQHLGLRILARRIESRSVTHSLLTAGYLGLGGSTPHPTLDGIPLVPADQQANVLDDANNVSVVKFPYSATQTPRWSGGLTAKRQISDNEAESNA